MKEQEYIFTGHRRIDIPTYGLKPGQLVAVGSKPSGGKISFGIDCALHASGKQDVPTIFFSLERSKDNLEKLIAIKNDTIPDKLYIDDTPALSIDDFENKLKDAIVEHGVRLVIIDYFQLLRALEFPWRSVAETYIIKRLKENAENLGITIIMLFWMPENSSRELFYKESPYIESQSDVVIEIEDYIPKVKKFAEPKIPLKEDGSLDTERINSLPFREYIDVIGSLSQEQVRQYHESVPFTESQEPIRPVQLDCTIEEAEEWGMMVDADKLLDEIREKYLNKK